MQMQLSMYYIEIVSGFHELLWHENWDYLYILISRDTSGMKWFHIFMHCSYVSSEAAFMSKFSEANEHSNCFMFSWTVFTWTLRSFLLEIMMDRFDIEMVLAFHEPL